MPATMLVPHPEERANRSEAERLVEPHAGVVGQGDTRERRDVAERSQLVQESLVQVPAGPATLLPGVKVDGAVGRPAISTPSPMYRG